MAEKSPVLKEAVKYKGNFSFSELYDFCFNWIKNEGYLVKEDTYTEKVSGDTKEIELKWTATKEISDYFKHEIILEWHILGMKKINVEVDGQEKKINNGEVKITFSINLIRDWEERWTRSPTSKFFRGVYDKYIIRSTKEDYEEKLKNISEKYIESVKSFLDVEGKK